MLTFRQRLLIYKLNVKKYIGIKNFERPKACQFIFVYKMHLAYQFVKVFSQMHIIDFALCPVYKFELSRELSEE